MAATGQDREDPDAVTDATATLPHSALCDTHVHVFDAARFPFAARRRFTPGYAGVDRLAAHLQRIGAGRVVLVQPSVYGNDHGCLADALQQLQGRGRGVAVLAPTSTAGEIAALDTLGVRATRINLVVDGHADVTVARDAVAQAARQVPAHWHVQLHVSLEVLRELSGLIRSSHCHFVLDHLGLPPCAPDAADSTGWQEVCDLAAAGKLSVKLSAPYLSAPDTAVLEPLARRLLRSAPGAALWGTNWPHTQGTARAAAAAPSAIEPFRTVDDTAWRARCQGWLAAAGMAADTFDTNAQRLYGF